MTHFHSLVLCIACILLSFYSLGQSGTYSDLLLTGPRLSDNEPIEIRHTDTNQSFFIRCLNEDQGFYGGGIGLSTPDNVFPLWVFATALSETLSLREEGVGIGSYNAAEPLHIYADGFPFEDASILVEHANGDEMSRRMLTLRNRGGSQIHFHNTISQRNWVIGSNDQSDVLNIGIVGDDTGLVYIRGELEVLSDKYSKNVIGHISESDVLSKLSLLPIHSYSFKNAPKSVRHIGPFAQDFYRIFNVGNGDKSISPMDGIGVAFASLKALHKTLNEKDEKIDLLQDQINELKSMVKELQESMLRGLQIASKDE